MTRYEELRDEFARAALIGLTTNSPTVNLIYSDTALSVARAAYNVANAMMQVRAEIPAIPDCDGPDA